MVDKIIRKNIDEKGRYLENFDVLDIAKRKVIDLHIDKHPNGKLDLPRIAKKDAIKLLELKGYL